MTTTVLVPGFSDDTHTLQHLTTYLRGQVVSVIALSPQPSDGRIGIDDLATMLAEQIEQIIRPEEALNLVGFSMGGLICRYYLQRLRPHRVIERLITIASPHRGTWSAYSFNRPACIQMRPYSRFLRDLNSDLSPLDQVAFTSIWSPFDLTIIPAVSSWLPVGKIITILSPLHQIMLYDRQVCETINACLKRPIANCD